MLILIYSKWPGQSASWRFHLVFLAYGLHFLWTRCVQGFNTPSSRRYEITRNKKHCYRRRTVRRNMLVNLVNNRNNCTTQQQIEAMELERYSRPTCSKQPRLVDCRIGIGNELERWRRETTDRQTQGHSIYRARIASRGQTWDYV